MKQGKASSSGPGSRKVEPTPNAMNPGAVADIGLQQVRTVPQPMHEGRGYKSPMGGSSNLAKGSQGRH
jgi:hypothetical protein